MMTQAISKLKYSSLYSQSCTLSHILCNNVGTITVGNKCWRHALIIMNSSCTIIITTIILKGVNVTLLQVGQGHYYMPYISTLLSVVVQF